MDFIFKSVVFDNGVRKAKLSFDDPNRQSMLDMGELCKRAIADFPGLLLSKIKVGLAGNTFHPAQVGVEFEISADAKLPKGYLEISISR